jgi:hypothetical protein
MPFNIVFLWNEVREEKDVVAASASCDSVEIYYTVENRPIRSGVSATVSSHTWFATDRFGIVEERLVLD